MSARLFASLYRETLQRELAAAADAVAWYGAEAGTLQFSLAMRHGRQLNELWLDFKESLVSQVRDGTHRLAVPPGLYESMGISTQAEKDAVYNFGVQLYSHRQLDAPPLTVDQFNKLLERRDI